MIRIEISHNDQKDIINLLDYALQKKKEDDDKEAYPKYWEIRISQLKQVLNGKNVNDSITKSTINFGMRKDRQC